MDFLALFGESAKKSPHLNVVFFVVMGAAKKFGNWQKSLGWQKILWGQGTAKKKWGWEQQKNFGGEAQKITNIQA